MCHLYGLSSKIIDGFSGGNRILIGGLQMHINQKNHSEGGGAGEQKLILGDDIIMTF